MQLQRDRDSDGHDAHAGPEQSQLIPQRLGTFQTIYHPWLS